MTLAVLIALGLGVAALVAVTYVVVAVIGLVLAWPPSGRLVVWVVSALVSWRTLAVLAVLFLGYCVVDAARAIRDGRAD